MDKQGLVAPVWSDAGTVPVGEVTYTGFEMPAHIASAIPVGEWVTVSLTYKDAAASWSIDFPPCDTVLGVVTIEPNSVRLPDPNAKPALPALTRVSGNKRGPGWCDE